MNISNKCDSCSKQSVCRFSAEYQIDCKNAVAAIKSSMTEITVKCKEFKANETTLRITKEKEDER